MSNSSSLFRLSHILDVRAGFARYALNLCFISYDNGYEAVSSSFYPYRSTFIEVC